MPADLDGDGVVPSLDLGSPPATGASTDRLTFQAMGSTGSMTSHQRLTREMTANKRLRTNASRIDTSGAGAPNVSQAGAPAPFLRAGL